jgi:hypothetical protein
MCLTNVMCFGLLKASHIKLLPSATTRCLHLQLDIHDEGTGNRNPNAGNMVLLLTALQIRIVRTKITEKNGRQTKLG